MDMQYQGVGLLAWFVPTLIGFPAITLWSRYYRRKLGDPSVAHSAS